MSIDQLPSGNWRARVMVARQRYTATFPTRDEAEEWLLFTRAKGATGELVPRMTVDQYVQRWLETAADPDRHRGHLEKHILPRLGRCQLAEVTPSDIKLLLNHVIQTADTPAADGCTELARHCSTRRSPTGS